MPATNNCWICWRHILELKAECDRLRIDVATERARAEKAERELAQAGALVCELSGKVDRLIEEFNRRGDLLAEAQKDTEWLETCAPKLVFFRRDVKQELKVSIEYYDTRSGCSVSAEAHTLHGAIDAARAPKP